MGDRGRIGDRWSSKVLWLCAVGSAIGLYFAAVEKQTQNRNKMVVQAQSLESLDSDSPNTD